MTAALLALLLSVPALDVETDHYRLTMEGTRAEADEAARVLEAAWGEFREFFGAEPKLGAGEKLRVVFPKTRDGFARALQAAGEVVPKAGGYYSPKTRTAYLWRQPTVYNTRQLLIHEATHQFHYLSRTGNRSPSAVWYVEGLAEYLSRHTWDGEELTLGVLPMCTLADIAARARADYRAGRFDLAGVLAGKAGARPHWWALVRYLATTDGKAFARLSKKLDRGGGAATAARGLGNAAKLEKRIGAWLEAEQEPWTPVFNQWEGIGEGRIEGTAPWPIVSACRIKAPARTLSAVLEIPEEERWRGGVLLHYAGKDDYTVALVLSGKSIRIDRRREGRWETLATAPCPAPRRAGLLSLKAVRQAGRVALFVEGKQAAALDLPGETLGLALQGTTIRFRDVTWE